MNILIFSTNSSYIDKKNSGGAETSLRLIAEKFASIGEKIVYVTISRDKIPSVKVRTINKVKVYFIAPIKWPTLIKGKPSQGKLHFIRFQIRLFLKKIISIENIDIVYTYSEYPDTYDILKLREKSKLDYKVVLRMAGLHWYRQCVETPESTKKIEWVFNKVDKIGFLTEGFLALFDEKTNALKMNISQSNQVILDIGFNNVIFKKAWTHHVNLPFKIVMVARFAAYQKRQDLLVKALNLLRDKDIELHFIGTGPSQSSIFNLASEYGILDKVFFHGFLEQKTIQKKLASSQLFCMATNYEGLCKSILEAMAVGIPVLCSNVIPVNTHITDRKNGFLCDNTPEAWAEAISEIYNGRSDLSAVSESAANFIAQSFNPDINIWHYKNEFSATIENRQTTNVKAN